MVYYVIVGYLSSSKDGKKIDGFKIFDVKNRLSFDANLYETSQLDIRGVPKDFLKFISKREYLKLSDFGDLYLGSKSYCIGDLPVFDWDNKPYKNIELRVRFNIADILGVNLLSAVVNLNDLSISYKYFWHNVNTLEDSFYKLSYYSDIKVDKEFIDCLWDRPEIELKEGYNRVGNLAAVKFINYKNSSIILDSNCTYIVGAIGGYSDFKGKEIVIPKECEMVKLHYCVGIYGVSFKFSKDSTAIVDFCKGIFSFKQSNLFKEYCSDLMKKLKLDKESALVRASVMFRVAKDVSKELILDSSNSCRALEILKGIGLDVEFY